MKIRTLCKRREQSNCHPREGGDPSLSLYGACEWMGRRLRGDDSEGEVPLPHYLRRLALGFFEFTTDLSDCQKNRLYRKKNEHLQIQVRVV